MPLKYGRAEFCLLAQMHLCYFLNANADPNNAADDDPVDVDGAYSDAPDTLMLPMFQVVQSMQRGKGLGRTKGRIKAVRKSSDPNDDDFAEKKKQ